MQDPFTISYDLRKVGTFQLSDIFYNTVGGAVGGLMYYANMSIGYWDIRGGRRKFYKLNGWHHMMPVKK